MRFMLSLGLASLLIAAGCSKDKDVEPPATLTKYQGTLPVKQLWGDKVGGGKAPPLLAAAAVSLEVGLLVGYLGSRVLGQYELVLVRDRGPERSPRRARERSRRRPGRSRKQDTKTVSGAG